jgi:hypothetical protein
MLVQLRELALRAAGQRDIVRLRRRRAAREICPAAIEPIDALAILGHRRGDRLPALRLVQMGVVRVDLFLSLLLVGPRRRPAQIETCLPRGGEVQAGGSPMPLRAPYGPTAHRQGKARLDAPMEARPARAAPRAGRRAKKAPDPLFTEAISPLSKKNRTLLGMLPAGIGVHWSRTRDGPGSPLHEEVFHGRH